jgi:uncharacterized protein YjaG (DUF416 family)
MVESYVLYQTGKTEGFVMAQAEDFTNIDEYEEFLSATISPWSTEQRVALAAAMAERWLHCYETFSQTERWGDPALLRRSLEALWNHVGGRAMPAADRNRFSEQLEENTPTMDEFDAYEALAACVIFAHALESADTGNNVRPAVAATLDCFDAAVPEWSLDDSSQSRQWRRAPARRELRKQLKLIDEIGAMKSFDAPTIAALRAKLVSRDNIGETVSKPKTKSPSPSAGTTNEAAFEQYRRMLETRLKQDVWVPTPDMPYARANRLITQWMSRYSLRKKHLDGEYAKLADIAAVHALMERYQFQDKASSPAAAWDTETRQYIERIYGNPLVGLDAGSPDAPHSFGPSVRRLWIEAKRQGKSDDEAVDAVNVWARHRPAAWAAEDTRKKKKQRFTVPQFAEYFAHPLSWTKTSDTAQPWEVEVDGQCWRVCINDFPDEIMYTLLVNGVVVGDFHDWPAAWTR